MSKNLRNTVIGAVAGTAAAGLLALPAQLPSAMANEEPIATLLKSQNDFFPPPFDTDGLYKPDTVTDETVSQDVINRSVVRKIGFGYTSYVTIVRTPTGVYSTDGLQSPHVRYPGIHQVAPEDGDYSFGQIALWDGSDWVSLDELDASSFFTLPPAAPAVVEEPQQTVAVPVLPISPVFEDEEDDETTTFVHPYVMFPDEDDEEPEPPPEEPEAPEEPDDEDAPGVLNYDPSIFDDPDEGPNAPDDVGPDDEGPTDEEPVDEAPSDDGDEDDGGDDGDEGDDDVEVSAAMVRI